VIGFAKRDPHEHPSAPATKAGDRAAADPAALMRIKSLQLRARIAMEGFIRGIHRSPYHGFSVEFSEYRQYTPGDDPRYLDWRLFARSDRYYVKRFEDETNLRCTIVLDTSRSMSFRSGEHSKYEYARTAAATLAYFLSTQRDAVGLATFEDRITEYLPPRHRPGQLRRLTSILDREPTGRVTDLAGPLEEIAAVIHKRGMVVILSDLLAPADLLQSRLGYLRSRGHDVLVLRVLDPAETDFRFETPAMFLDQESGRQLFVDPSTARAGYLQKFQAHADQLAAACSDLGVELSTMTTDRPLELVLFDLVRARGRRSMAEGRRSVARGGSRR
jgi:uncharacterized protein (DUF58 family)